MKLRTPAWKNAGSAAAIVLIAVGILPGTTGCGSNNKKTAAEAASTPTGLTSQNLQKLTPQQVDQRIQEVQANTSIPESAKPNIIDSIRAQGQP